MFIGAFSKYVKTTEKTLRYYDRIGLFCPAAIDPITGYRNYTVEQLTEFEQIRQYRDAGLSIEQIRRLLSGENRENILKEHQQELIQQEFILFQKKEAVASLLHAPQNTVYSVQLKELPTYTVCTCRTRVANATYIATAISSRLCEMKQLYPTLEFTHPNYCCVTFTDESHKDNDIEIEYAEAVTTSCPDTYDFQFKTLTGGIVACVKHRGSYNSISGAYAVLLRWITTKGYHISGAVRERYIHGAWDCQNEADWVTEIQVPLDYIGGMK